MSDVLRRPLHFAVIAGIGHLPTPAVHTLGRGVQALSCRHDRKGPVTTGGWMEALPNLLSCVQKDDLAGLNRTHPDKPVAAGLIDDPVPEGGLLDFVTAIIFANGRRLGQSADWRDFAHRLHGRLPGVDRAVRSHSGRVALGSSVQSRPLLNA